jgi:hypothetical protein
MKEKGSKTDIAGDRQADRDRHQNASNGKLTNSGSGLCVRKLLQSAENPQNLCKTSNPKEVCWETGICLG